MLRRRFRTVISCAGLLLAAPAAAQRPAITVILLGTGTPVPRADRLGPSTLVQAGSQQLLFDVGRDVPVRLAQIHVPLGQISALFITHLHSDHVVGFPDFWLTGRLANPQFAHRTQPLLVYGPAGTRAMIDALRAAFRADLEFRAADEKLPAVGAAIVTTEIEQGLVYDSAGVKVTAFIVDHGDLIKPAFGYRIDYGGHSVVLSGDTRPSENLIQFAAGADLLVHEVATGSPADRAKSEAMQRVLAHHTSPEAAGRIFARVKPKLAVYSHIVFLSYDPAIAPPTIADLVTETRTTYTGPLEVGEDLMSIAVGDHVVARRFGAWRP